MSKYVMLYGINYWAPIQVSWEDGKYPGNKLVTMSQCSGTGDDVKLQTLEIEVDDRTLLKLIATIFSEGKNSQP
jgi:hypothetical protein